MENINVMMAKASTLSSHTTGASKKTVKYMQASYVYLLNILAVSVPICIVGLIANAIVLCLYCCKINKPKLGPYFLSMTFTNLIIILCNLEVAAFILAGVETSSMVKHLMEILHIFAYDTNLYVTTFLTADRFLIVYFPVWWQLHRTKHFTVMMCMVLWIISGLESMVEFFSCYATVSTWAYNTCRTASLLALIIEIIIFSSCIFCFTFAIWIRMQRSQQNYRARLDITIVAIAILILLLTVPVRFVNIISFWVSSINYYMFTSISLLLDCCASSSIPFVFLIVGSWNRQKAFEPFCMFLERALKDTEDTSEPTAADQEQA
ncbi:proto-oncogene Mas-like [Lacerta agilis]|uniref:proto-oncogene Mas-like n=1 Tax=Lacerta agilis TaxID=80427 RepID=UPI00141992BA|nr:proto-oncogene Mas-like [Lacerta agilis]